MVSLLKRFRYTLEADLHALFDKKEEKNPIAMLNQYIREAEKQTEQTGKLLERQRQLKHELERKLKETNEMLEKRKHQLELAKSSGEEDLISFAIQEVDAYSNRQKTLQESLEQANKECILLEQKFETMKHKIKDMKIRQLQLMGKENVIRANTKMNHILDDSDNMNFNELSSYIDNLAEKINQDVEYTQLESRLARLEEQNKSSLEKESTSLSSKDNIES